MAYLHAAFQEGTWMPLYTELPYLAVGFGSCTVLSSLEIMKLMQIKRFSSGKVLELLV